MVLLYRALQRKNKNSRLQGGSQRKENQDLGSQLHGELSMGFIQKGFLPAVVTWLPGTQAQAGSHTSQAWWAQMPLTRTHSHKLKLKVSRETRECFLKIFLPSFFKNFPATTSTMALVTCSMWAFYALYSQHPQRAFKNHQGPRPHLRTL